MQTGVHDTRSKRNSDGVQIFAELCKLFKETDELLGSETGALEENSSATNSKYGFLAKKSYRRSTCDLIKIRER